MGRIVHFEIHVNDMERAKAFYGEVFGWSFQDWSDYAGMPYFGAVTGNENEHGIDGALITASKCSAGNRPSVKCICVYHWRGKLRFNGS